MIISVYFCGLTPRGVSGLKEIRILLKGAIN